jgi:hypothetical protein
MKKYLASFDLFEPPKGNGFSQLLSRGVAITYFLEGTHLSMDFTVQTSKNHLLQYCSKLLTNVSGTIHQCQVQILETPEERSQFQDKTKSILTLSSSFSKTLREVLRK